MKKKIIKIVLLAVLLCMVISPIFSIRHNSTKAISQSPLPVVLTIDDGTSQNSEIIDANNTEEKFDWSKWFKDKCLPVLIAVGTSIVTICTFLYPVLNTVNGGIKLFKGSKEKFENVTNQVVESQHEITEFKQYALLKITELKEETQHQISNILSLTKNKLEEINTKSAESFNNFSKILVDMAKQLNNQNKVMKIAFGNSEELVKNGYANEIMKIGAEDATGEIKEKNNIDANS